MTHNGSLFSRSITLTTRLLFLFFIFLFYSVSLFAGTSGKISGKVVDSKTNEPIVGANVIIEGTYLGAAADEKGYYFINNIPPGEYRVIITALGYQKTVYQKVLVKIDLTTHIDIKLNTTTINLDKEIVVTAERPLVQKDLTSTSATITSGDIMMMPVEDVGAIINLQAGVVGGHFRGGRSNEVAYMVDGVSVGDAYNSGLSVQIENASIRQMEVISGTFNAEYGQAMSGIVNIITQDGTPTFGGSVSGYVGNYYTSHNDLFMNLNTPGRIASKDIQASFFGPTGLPNLTFFLTGRYFYDEGSLYGQRFYNINDNWPNGTIQNLAFWVPQHSGDNSYVPMNPSEKKSFNGKLTYSFPTIKFSYSVFYDDNFNKYFNQAFAWNPDGIMSHYRTDFIQNLQISHYPSQNTFQSLKFSFNQFIYKGYVFENPLDPAYVDPSQGIPKSDYTFNYGGVDPGRYERSTKSLIGQWALSSQLSKEHKIGIGIEGRFHQIYNHGYNLVNLTDGQIDSVGNLIFTPGYRNLGADGNQAYTKKPMELSAYIQDKMEYDIMIINAGVRLDYFNAFSSQPADLKNAMMDPNFPGYNQWQKASAKYQISPRLGASFPITDQGVIRFSYGHFFQIPNYENLFTNSDFLITQGQSLSSVVGNPDLKAQRTVMYEIGLQQVIFPNVVLNASVYYRDIRNLLGMEIINTYNGSKYARFINRDYGNVRGFIVTLEKRFSDYFSAKIDYTYQIAEGNSSDPYSVYNDNQTNPPIEEPKVVVPLDWDQRHTLNMSVNVGVPGDWTVGLIFQYGSGWPYTEDIKISQGVRFANGGVKPATYNVDMRADKEFTIGGININTFLLIYNLFDIKNEYGVYSTTGRANVDLNVKYSDPTAISRINTISQYVNNPGMYSSPREIRLGFGFGI